MSLIRDLLDKPATLSAASRYTAMNGDRLPGLRRAARCLAGRDPDTFHGPDFVGQEEALIRVVGMTVAVIGWLYLFGGRSGARQIVAASVVDRLVLVPAVLVPVVIAGVFPHLLLTFAVLDPALAVGAWVFLARRT